MQQILEALIEEYAGAALVAVLAISAIIWMVI